MKKIYSNQTKIVIGGGCTASGQIVTGVLCTGSIVLLYTPWAPVAAGTGILCGLGALAGCAPAS